MYFKELIKSFSDERWNIGFLENTLDSVMRGDNIRVKWMNHHLKNSWFADPFILDVTDDEIIVMVEEFYKPILRGRISKLTIDKKSLNLKNLDVVLELPTHLSFPVIIRPQEKTDFVYLMPENGESGELNTYQYWPQENRIEKCETVLKEAVADAIPFEFNGTTYLFATDGKNVNGNELSIYQWDDDAHQYIFDRKLDFEENVARMAGNCFMYQGELYRPTQECNVQYGHAVTIQKIKMVNNHWNFEEIRRMYSVNPKLNVGMHTLNMHKGIIVTDALGFDNMWFRTMLKTLHIL